MDAETLNIKTYYFSLKSNLSVQIITVTYVKYFVNFLEIIFGGPLFQKVATLYTLTSSTVNSVEDIFLQILQKFQNTAIFKTIFNDTVNQSTC